MKGTMVLAVLVMLAGTAQGQTAQVVIVNALDDSMMLNGITLQRGHGQGTTLNARMVLGDGRQILIQDTQQQCLGGGRLITGQAQQPSRYCSPTTAECIYAVVKRNWRGLIEIDMSAAPAEHCANDWWTGNGRFAIRTAVEAITAKPAMTSGQALAGSSPARGLLRQP